MEEVDNLPIKLEDVISATDNFAQKNRIGRGGFGSVYKGEVSHPDGLITVACKRLDPKLGQGDTEFLKEIRILSKYKHENLVSLLHYCVEGNERILLYKYVSGGSLDRYLSNPSLTWTQRLKICLGVANALNYLHDPADTHQRIFHRDIKSSNILLDEEWNAKVSDFGLSKFAPANEPQSYVHTRVVGTQGYWDPMYLETGILSKESDVYSFGVVLFEVMCGKLCCEYDRDSSKLIHAFVPEWKRCFKERRLDDIVCHGLKERMDLGSLNTFSTIAYQCLKRDREKRPKMAEIVQQLKIALEEQEGFDEIIKRTDIKELQRIATLAVTPLSYRTSSQLHSLLMEGVLVDDGETWISVNNRGQQRVLISLEKCYSSYSTTKTSNKNLVSRFPHLFDYWSNHDLTLNFKTQFLSPNVTYIINLVYECNIPTDHYQRIPIKYKVEEMSGYSTSCVAQFGEDGWLRTELFQFTSTKNEHYFNIHCFTQLKTFSNSFRLKVEGIEFFPIGFENDENKVDHVQPSDIDWGERLPHDYKEIVKDIEESMTKKEIFFLLRKGVYINNSQQWFSISKKSKKRLMLPARAIIQWKMSWLWKSMPGSRFNEVAESCDKDHLAFSIQLESQLLSPDTTYSCYLIFQLPENASVFEGIVKAGFKERGWFGTSKKHYIYLNTPPHTPIIGLSPDTTPSRTRRIKGHTKVRKDGWKEIPMWEFELDSESFRVEAYLKSVDEWNFTGLLIQGIEFRPSKI